jgi:hypothetical protein
MSTTYNHYKDTYFKQQGSSGAISNGSSTYSLRNDGNTYLNGNLDTTTINSVALTNLPNLPYLDTTSSITSQLASKQAVLSNASFLDVTSSAQTQINTINTTLNGKTTLVIVQSNNNLFSGNNAFSGTNTFNSYLPTSTLTPTTSTQLITKNYGDATYATITNLTSTNSNVTANTTSITNLNTLLTGASWDNVYSYLNLSNNLHIYGTLQLAGLSTDVNSTFTNVYSSLASKQATLTSSSVISCSTINGNSLTNLGNLQYLDISSSLTTQLATKTTLSAIQSN